MYAWAELRGDRTSQIRNQQLLRVWGRKTEPVIWRERPERRLGPDHNSPAQAGEKCFISSSDFILCAHRMEAAGRI